MLERHIALDGWVLWTLDGRPAVLIRELAHEQRVIVWLVPARTVLGTCRSADVKLR